MGDPATMAGRIVEVETILWENPDLAHDRYYKDFTPETEQVLVPAGQRTGGVPQGDYDAYRRGLDSACADVVLCARREDVTPVVLASKRGTDKPFGGCWWMQGGAIHSYRSILDFVSERVEKECGVRPRVEGLIGFYRTCAPDGIASTIQPCYVASVPLAAIEQANIDADHSSWALLSLEDLDYIPAEEQHWYPMRVFRLALETMP